MNQSRTIRLPVHVVKELNQVLRAQRSVEAENGVASNLETDPAGWISPGRCPCDPRIE